MRGWLWDWWGWWGEEEGGGWRREVRRSRLARAQALGTLVVISVQMASAGSAMALLLHETLRSIALLQKLKVRLQDHLSGDNFICCDGVRTYTRMNEGKQPSRHTITTAIRTRYISITQPAWDGTFG